MGDESTGDVKYVCELDIIGFCAVDIAGEKSSSS